MSRGESSWARSAWSSALRTVLLVSLGALPGGLVQADIPVSHTFTFQQGFIYWISRPESSSIQTAQQLKAALANPSLNLEVAQQFPTNPPTFACFPLGSTIIDDSSPSDPEHFTCAGVDAADLTFQGREGIWVRVTNGTTSLTWSGTEPLLSTFQIVGVEQLVSIPYPLTPITADEILDDVLQSSGTVTRLLPGNPPSFDFWNGSNGANFSLPEGEAVKILCLDCPPILSKECIVEPNGGTAELPPAGCSYLSPNEIHFIVGGLPPGTQVNLQGNHGNFVCNGGCETPPPSGTLNSFENFDSTLTFNLTGTGLLESLDCTLTIPNVPVVVETGPRDLGAETQTIAAEMKSMDTTFTNDTTCNLFSSLQIEAGSDQGLAPSTGMTTLQEVTTPLQLNSTSQRATGEDAEVGDYKVNSYFDVNFRMTWVGKPGGPLAGMSGTHVGQVRMGTPSTLPVPVLSPQGVVVLVTLMAAAMGVLYLRRRSRGAAAIA